MDELLHVIGKDRPTAVISYCSKPPLLHFEVHNPMQNKMLTDVGTAIRKIKKANM